MEADKTLNRIHPLIAAAAVSVILLSAVGVAAITGIIPVSHGATAPIAITSPGTVRDNRAATDNLIDAPAQPVAASTTQYRETPPLIAQAEAPQQYSRPQQVTPAQPICKSCGKIESVRIVHHQARPSGIGVVAGAVLGGVLGNQVGGGNGRSLATVAGAVGGGYAGNEIEKRSHVTTSYQVRVRMEGGHIRHFTYAAEPNWRAGDHVRVTNGRLTSSN